MRGCVEGMKEDGSFCRAFLRTMDPERAALESGRQDGFEVLSRKTVQNRLERMRADAAGQIRRDDAVRRLAQMAFGRANDAFRLALYPGEVDLNQLDLSAVSELKVTEKGVEIRLVDRVRALEALCNLLENSDGGTADAFYQALEEAAKMGAGESSG